jgi:hypothetical protein
VGGFVRKVEINDVDGVVVTVGVDKMIRALRVVRPSAMQAGTQAANQLQAVIVTAPDRLRRLPIGGAGGEGVAPGAGHDPNRGRGVGPIRPCLGPMGNPRRRGQRAAACGGA